MEHKHVPTLVLIAIIVVAAAALYITFRAPSEGKATELVIKYQKVQITPCCCVKQDPNGIRRDHISLYYARSPQECTCYPKLYWVPTDLKYCHVRTRR